MRTAKLNLISLVVVVITWAPMFVRAEDLPSWNDGPAKNAIVQFVGRVTREGSPDFVPPAERIATFDNDGTLWPEQPIPVQLAFAIDRVKALAPKHPEWKHQEPFASLLKGDVKGALAGGDKAIVRLLMTTHAGMTTAEFARIVKGWMATARDPRFKAPYTRLAYEPMLELLRFLRANGFKTFIVSGGGADFMRPWTQQVYGIPPEQVIGSTIETEYEMKNGMPELIRLPKIDFVDNASGKVIAIHRYIGRHPIAAFGNSDGDREMLEWTRDGKGPRLAMLVRHDDARREYAYGSESKLGISASMLAEAKKHGWVLVSMKNDWKRIFPFGQ